MVVTPFSELLLAIPLQLFGKSIHIYCIFYALIVTALTFLLDKLYKEKGWIALLYYGPHFVCNQHSQHINNTIRLITNIFRAKYKKTFFCRNNPCSFLFLQNKI